MKMLDKSNYPHSELIKDNNTINLRSIFDFTKGSEELFSFLFGCKKHNCTVYFENEKITVNPDSESEKNMILSVYALIATNPKIANDYMRYLNLISETERNPQLADTNP